ncbi:tip elongation aberrant protein 1 isoform X1 [Ricinus communis]|uniref:tip elongation aberrant protein 1 isoform X1 n=1 Tax=Ricinus communis TaxID=3988 RepID=UPI00201AC040|nr:tip elongation aberrant protein 1 isoform X1 [Ricinus communis]
MRWERLQQQQQSSNINNGPGKRWGHTCNSVKGGRFLYVFGGYGKDNCQTNQVHVFDTATQTWSQPVIKGTPPTPRDSHSCTTVGDSLYVFGGTDGMNPLKDLHILDTLSHTWIAPAVRGEGPEAREGHSAALVGKRLFIFGGCGKSSNNNDEVYFNDLYILNTETFVWKKAVTSGTPPSARDSHTCSSWKNKIIVIGGEDGHDYYLSDVHILDAETLVWKELNATGQKLPPRAGHSTVSFGKNLFVFGGFTDAQNLYDDLYMLDVDTGVWTKIMTAGIGPSARFSVAGDCLDPQIGGVLVFIGGCNKSLEALDDMYYLYTGLARIRDELRLEKLSLRKQLKLKCQEQNLNSPVHDKALLRIDTSSDFHHTVPTYVQPSRENLRLNQVQLHQGKKTFQAKVTECFPHGYTIETIIDGKPLHGILFANKPISSPMASQSNSRKRVSAEIGPLLNSDHNNKSKTSKALKQDGVDHLQPDNVHGKETLMHESKPEADAKNLPSDVSQLYEVPSNLEPSVAPLNLNDDMISDAPNSDTGFAKEFFTPAKESITLSIKQGKDHSVCDQLEVGKSDQPKPKYDSFC